MVGFLFLFFNLLSVPWFHTFPVFLYILSDIFLIKSLKESFRQDWHVLKYPLYSSMHAVACSFFYCMLRFSNYIVLDFE